MRRQLKLNAILKQSCQRSHGMPAKGMEIRCWGSAGCWVVYSRGSHGGGGQDKELGHRTILRTLVVLAHKREGALLCHLAGKLELEAAHLGRVGTRAGACS